MAIGKFGNPNMLGTLGAGPLRPRIMGGIPAAKPAVADSAQRNAMPPAGLPPDAWADVVHPINPTMKPKPGALRNAQAPRRVTPTPPNQAAQDALFKTTQRTDQLSPDQVMGMNNQDWQQLLSQFGVFA